MVLVINNKVGLGLSDWRPYRFNDTPDGEDFFKKLGCAGRWGGGIGLMFAAVDVPFISHPKTYSHALGRVIYVAGPILGMACAFSSVTYFSANMRGNKDGCLNHFFGGAAAGCVYGAWMRSISAGCYGALFMGLFAAIKKDLLLHGLTLDPVAPVQYSTNCHYKFDFTLVKDGERSWTTDPNDTYLDPRVPVQKMPFNTAT